MSHQRGGEQRLISVSMISFVGISSAVERFPFVYPYEPAFCRLDAMKKAMEAWEWDMPYCMGSLVWQHNDCRPVASWLSRDYYDVGRRSIILW